MLVIIAAFIIALILSLATVPMFSYIAHRVGLIDEPDNNRKLHGIAIPMVGGLAVFLATCTTTIGLIALDSSIGEHIQSATDYLSTWLPVDAVGARASLTPNDFMELFGLLIGAALLLLVGLADDRFAIRGRQKLLGQFMAATVLIIFGFEFDHIIVLGMRFDFGIFSVLVVYAWLLASINSVNLLDGADGIASTIGIVMSIAICFMSMTTGKIVDAVLAASIAGALLGFLKFNFPPAKAYLGDSGSMLIGFLLGALAMRCMFKQHAAYAFFAPVALLAIPFIDTGAAIIRRRLTGRSIFEVDRGHLHHALMKRGYTPRTSLLWVALMCSTTAAGSVMSWMFRQSEYALASIVIVMVVMVGCKIFGVAEYQLVSRRASSLAKSFFNIASRNRPDVLQSSVHVQGSHNWQEVWKLLCDFADKHRLNQLTMDLNAPWLHESFHATRKRADADRGENKEWFAHIPLVVEGRSFGRIEINGSHVASTSHHEVISNIMKVTADIEMALVHAKSSIDEAPIADAEPDSSAVSDSSLDFSGSETPSVSGPMA